MIKVSDPITRLIKNFLKEGITFKCNEKGRMGEKIMVTWLTEVCDRRPSALLKERGIVVLHAFKGHLPFILSGWVIKF
jgi:hypothetical protein